SGKADKWSAASMACPEIASDTAIEALAREARGRQPRGNQVETPRIVWRDRAARDQAPGEVERLVHVRSSSLIEVLARVASSTRLTMTAQASECVPSLDGRLPGTTTDPDGTRP